MRISRTLPPAAVPIPWRNLVNAVRFTLLPADATVDAFAASIQRYFEVRHCFLLNSGKAALTLILQALHALHPGRDEVVIPAFTCYSVPAAVKRAGLRIRLCDLDPRTLDFHRDELARIARDDDDKGAVLAVVPTHLYGVPADVAFCRRIFPADVAVIEDAAQAMGAESSGKRLGTSATAGFFSLGRGKALSAIEGGIIVTDRDDMAERLQRALFHLPAYSAGEKARLMAKAAFTSVFQRPELFWFPRSLPFLRLGETVYEPDLAPKRLSSLHCCLTAMWEERLGHLSRVRKTNVRRFLELSQNKFESAIFPWLNEEQALIRLPVLVNTQEACTTIVQSGFSQRMGIMPSYPAPVSEIPELQDELGGARFPAAELLSARLITIPTHEYMMENDYRRIVAFIESLTGKRTRS